MTRPAEHKDTKMTSVTKQETIRHHKSEHPQCKKKNKKKQVQQSKCCVKSLQLIKPDAQMKCTAQPQDCIPRLHRLYGALG